MKPIILTLMFLGVIFIVVGYVNQIKKCPPPKIEYRFIPRTFDEEQENQALVSEIFKDMFEQPSTWIAGFRFSGKPSVAEIERNLIRD